MTFANPGCRGVAILGVTALLAAPVGGQSPASEAVESPSPGTRVPGELSLFAGIGRVTYQESVSLDPVDSDWDAAALTIGGAWTYANPSGYLLRGTLSGWWTGSETEVWTGGGSVLQRNDLELYGGELGGDFGIHLHRDEAWTVRLWGGLGYAWQEFERSAFDTPQGNDVLGGRSVGESYDVVYVRLALDADAVLSTRWRWSGQVLGGPVFFNEAENELLGTIEGDGGLILSASTFLWYQPWTRSRVGVGVMALYQELDGAASELYTRLEDGSVVRNAVEWPDNELTQLSAEVRWAMDL